MIAIREDSIAGSEIPLARADLDDEERHEMSIAVLIGVHDGVVLAADSASTLSMTPRPGVGVPAGVPGFVANVYDNANKIFNVVKGLPIGCITFGSGNIGNSSIGTLIKDLRKKLTLEPNDLGFKASDYTMESVANILASFLAAECDRLDDSTKSNTTLGLLVGGYSSKGELGESWLVDIVKGTAQPPKQLRKPEAPGINWGGQAESLHRLIAGYSPELFNLLSQLSNPPQVPAEMAKMLMPVFAQRLQAPLAFAPMPIQDAIDLARFLVHTAIMFSRFLPGPNIVGGPIEIAVITKHENFKWISRKHYYDSHLNQEPIHVICD